MESDVELPKESHAPAEDKRWVIGPDADVELPMYEGAIEMTEKQACFFESTADVTVAQAGIRGGKTEIGSFKKIIGAMNDPCELDETHLVTSPTYPMSRVPVDKIFTQLYNKKIFPVCPLIYFHKSSRTFLLHANGAKVTRITVVSLHEPNRIRGIKARSAWLDEGAYVTQEAWDIVQGRLADTDGPADITTTPAGYNFVHKLYEKACDERDAGIPMDERTHRFIHWATYENPFLEARGVERLAGAYDARTYGQEVKALFMKLAGLVYFPFSKSKNVQTGRWDRSKLIYVGQDFNVMKMATVLMQKFTTQDKHEGLHILFARLAPDSGTAAVVHFLDRFLSEHHLSKSMVRIVPDASGKARTTTGRSDHQIFRAAGYRVDAPSKNPPVKDRINCVNGLIAPMTSPYPRLLVDPSVQPVLDTFTKQIWKKDSDPPEPDKEHGLDHIADALGYPCHHLFPIRMKASLGSKRKAA